MSAIALAKAEATSNNTMADTLLVIAGPTAVGKSEVAVEVAKRLDGEIINADSRQIYRGLDILTAKPSSALRRAVRHHLVGVVKPGDEVNAFDFGQRAEKAIGGCLRRKRAPILCGGSGLYIRAVTDGLFPGARSDPVIRRQFLREVTMHPRQMHAALARVDPLAAAEISPNDLRRIARGLEVYAAGGGPISSKQAEGRQAPPRWTAFKFVLTRQRQELYQRCDRRVDAMLAQGLLAEVRSMAKRAPNHLMLESLGCRELLAHLRGEISLETALTRMKQATRNYAKRQLTWFRKERGARWIDLSEVKAKEAVEMIVSEFGARSSQLASEEAKITRSKVESRGPSSAGRKKGGYDISQRSRVKR